MALHVTTMRLAVGALFALFALLAPALAADAYPPLTGRVVDAANVLPEPTRAALEAKLKTLEDKSGIQLEVATIPSLGGNEIEPYANGLFRFWKLGEQKKNNGVLLLVAPVEHKVRIEVGYGLEGTLTDALSNVIITNAMVPRFKTGDYAGGIERGTDDIITVLTTDSADWQKRPDLHAQEAGGSPLDTMMPFLVFAVFVIVIIYLNRQTGLRAGGRPGGGIVFLPTGGSGWGGGSSGGFGGDGGGGGFSGGGGSSGGGGASGGW